MRRLVLILTILCLSALGVPRLFLGSQNISNTSSSAGSTTSTTLEHLLKAVKERENLIRNSVKDICLKFSEENSFDEKYKKMEWEFIERRLKGQNQSKERKLVGPTLREPPKEFLWRMKNDKLRIDLKGDGDGEFKILELFDGEKTISFYYFENMPQNSSSSKGQKQGDIMQVQIRKSPSPNLYNPFLYLGFWVGNQWLSEVFKNYQVKYIGAEKLGGQDCYILELNREVEWTEGAGNKKVRGLERQRLWLDPAIGYGIRKITNYSPAYRDEISFEVVFNDFKKYLGKIFLPNKVEILSYSTKAFYGKNVPVEWTKITIKEIEINSGIPDSVFVPAIPSGIPIFDQMVGRAYKAGQKQPTDDDIMAISEVAKDYLRGKISLKQLGEYAKKGQLETYYCGPNALLAVCGILGVKTSSQEIAKLAGTDEKGNTSMAGLKRAAEALGLKVEAMDLTLDELRQTKKLAIAWLPPGHYIVVVGFADDKVVIIDPPTVLAVVPISGLDNLWDGRALLVSKP